MTPRPLALLALLAVVAGPPASAQPLVGDAGVPLIENPDGREHTSLDGVWRVIVDPFEVGYYSHDMRPEAGRRMWEDRRPRSDQDLIEYSFDASRDQLRVPGDWNTQDDRLFLYEGTVWYRRLFDDSRTDADRVAGRRLFLRFGAANYHARVWLNGEKLGEHVGGFTPFEFEVTDRLRPGAANTLVVQVDNQRHADAVPTINFDWWNYGGLTRDVLLVETPATFVRDYYVGLDPEDPSRAVAWVRLDGPDAAGADVAVAVPDAALAAPATTDADGLARLTLPAQTLRRWSDRDPHRYTVTVAGADDQVADRIGFRTVETRGRDILLNGEPVYLRGISLHEEAPYGAGRAFSRDHAETLLGWARGLDANFVRLAHYPHNRHTVELADSLGLLVWAEVPVYWTIDWENPETYANAERQLREMIARDKNRAAVVIYSVGNEAPDTPARLRFMGGLAETAKRIDPTRLVSAAILHTGAGREDGVRVERLADPLGAYLDVLGLNEYAGWYFGTPALPDSMRWEIPYDKPVVVSEFGAGAVAGLHDAGGARWSEEYQRAVYEHQLAMLARVPEVRGISPWVLVDFRSPRRPLARIQDFWNRKGLLSETGQRKAAYDVLGDFYRRVARLYDGGPLDPSAAPPTTPTP